MSRLGGSGLLLWAVSWAVLVAAPACRGEPDRPPPAGGSQSPPAAGGGGGSSGDGGRSDEDAGGDAGDCNELENGGPVVDQNGVTGQPSTGSGGTIADGTYELTLAQVYVGAAGFPGPTGQEVQATMRFSAGTFERVKAQGAAGAPLEDIRTSGIFATNGSTLTLTSSCPLVAQEQLTYSVISNTVVLTSLVTNESFTFTLR